jgi:hypothetical protein
LNDAVRLMQADPVNPDESTEVAAFWMDGDTVRSEYSDPGWEREMEGRGIFVGTAGQLFPKDGPVFFELLPLAFSNSSRMRLEYYDRP